MLRFSTSYSSSPLPSSSDTDSSFAALRRASSTRFARGLQIKRDFQGMCENEKGTRGQGVGGVGVRARVSDGDGRIRECLWPSSRAHSSLS